MRRIEYGYDSQGNNNLITSYDAATGGNIVNQVQRTFNDLGQMTGEYQSHGGAVVPGTTPQVQYAYTEMSGGQNNSRLVSMTYPSGYTLNYNYNTGLDNNISRLSSLSDNGGALESYKYLGLDTVVERNHPQNNINLSYIQQSGDAQANSDGGDQYTGLDRFGRVIDQNWVNGTTGTSTDRFQYGYSQDSDVLYRQNLVDAALSELYGYDSLHQLTSYQQGTLNSTHNGLVGTATNSQSWSPDALGNFTSVTTNGTTQTRTANQQNEITSISGAGAVTYDANGNITADGSGNTFVYDAWNRLIAVKNGSTTVASYTYDGLGRRITETHGSTTTDLYLSAANQVLEERVGGVVQARNVWSPVYVNALILRDLSSQQNGTLDQRLYVQQDANWNVTALVDTNGNVVERYAYTPYGTVTVLNPDGTVRSGSSYAMPFLWQGERYDAAANLYHTFTRDVSPALMRPLQADSLGLMPGNNDYEWEGNGPTDRLDPTGMDWDWYDYFGLIPITAPAYFAGRFGQMGYEYHRGMNFQAQLEGTQQSQNALATQDITNYIPRNGRGEAVGFGLPGSGSGLTPQQAGPAGSRQVKLMGMFVAGTLLTEGITRIGPGIVARPLTQLLGKALERSCLSLEGGILRRLTAKGTTKVLTGAAKEAAEQQLERELRTLLKQRVQHDAERALARRVLDRKYFPNDGIQNETVRELLGGKKGTWTEWVVPSGPTTPGKERLITGNGQVWYSPNHYQGFIRIDDGSFKVVGTLAEVP